MLCNRDPRSAHSTPALSGRDSDRPLQRPLQRREGNSSRCGKWFKWASDTASSYVTRHAGIDFQAPAIDAAFHADALFDTLLAQPVYDLQAAHAVMAKYNQWRLLGFQRVQRLRNGAHRNQQIGRAH